MPWARTRWAATSSCVDSGLEAHSATWAPPAFRATTRLAVSVVTCRQAARRLPLSGRSRANRSLSSRSTGIERSAHSVRRRPSSARRMSLMSWAAWDAVAVSDIGLPSGASRPFGRDLQLLDAIDVLQGEQFDFPVADLAPLGGATEMAVRRGRTENRIAQIECLDDARRREIEHFADGGLERFLRNRARAERVHHDGHRLGRADPIGALHLRALGQARRGDVTCHPTARR